MENIEENCPYLDEPCLFNDSVPCEICPIVTDAEKDYDPYTP